MGRKQTERATRALRPGTPRVRWPQPQEDLAGEAGIDRTYPSLLERGRREPTLDVFFRLSTALRQPPAALLEATLTQLAGCAGAPRMEPGARRSPPLTAAAQPPRGWDAS
jgi:transcriptional regulator with XRE-family HTH domain